MSNPFAPLQAVLDLMVTEAEVLPAFGRALVELATPNPGEAYDREVNPETRVQGIWETGPTGLYREVRPLRRSESHFLRFFCKGSTRVFFLGTLLERERSTPIQIAQVGVAVLERQENGAMRIPCSGTVGQTALVLDTKGISDHLRTAIEAAMPEGFELWNTGTEELSAEARIRGARVANTKMRELGWRVAETLHRDLDSCDSCLVLGQSLGNEFTGWQGPPLIGVTQDFRQDLLFVLQKQERSLYQLLAELPTEARTAVFPREWKGHRGEIVSWYVRIRDARGLDFPLAGVIRAELPNHGGQKVETAFIDHLTQHLVAERTVAPYGSGPGWHAHLYPIHLADKVVRGRFHSEEVVKASLRWQLPGPPVDLRLNG